MLMRLQLSMTPTTSTTLTPANDDKYSIGLLLWRQLENTPKCCQFWGRTSAAKSAFGGERAKAWSV